MIEILTNPWVIIIIVLSIVVGNIAALKYTAKMKFGQMDKSRKNDLDKLNELDKERYGEESEKKDENR
ncbi:MULTISPECIES: DUF2897 family protein [Vibrio]|jgi:hypothetical protein|uniref:DUF2897 domain-containing protein n=1 Tax=Vibrio harveyi TaxID=669 RepID=A0A1E3E8C5_VIBHA|nr:MULTISPECIES: DUF2897 family protein [Vibrio]AIV06404.1 hypothetical protein LA59_13375 [Vibrio harveyi]AMF97190.1 DUF2897 domain-containing protein [Vibrio harveyi]APP05358.1 DUF2897 domain-containing protein [Vibrio harveyi]AWA99769.1 DUF2897 domain-containing protein [Vibrio harveyi]EKO3783844.1 DUF2897 family protein [Vibrio harveyi]